MLDAKLFQLNCFHNAWFYMANLLSIFHLVRGLNGLYSGANWTANWFLNLFGIIADLKCTEASLQWIISGLQ